MTQFNSIFLKCSSFRFVSSRIDYVLHKVNTVDARVACLSLARYQATGLLWKAARISTLLQNVKFFNMLNKSAPKLSGFFMCPCYTPTRSSVIINLLVLL